MVTVVLLIVVGVLLLALEVVLPGGIAGLAGIGCLIAGVVVGYIDFGPGVGNILLALAMLIMLSGAVAWFAYFPKSRLGQIFVSKGKVGNAEYALGGLADKEGKTVSELRPSGVAKIDGTRYDVVTEGGFVGKQVAVKVVDVEGNRIVVRVV